MCPRLPGPLDNYANLFTHTLLVTSTNMVTRNCALVAVTKLELATKFLISHEISLWFNLVPRARVSFGQHQDLLPRLKTRGLWERDWLVC